MGKVMDQDHLEKLLREPDNLFGPPTGEGYDYVRAALIVSALALGALSGWCLFTLWTDQAGTLHGAASVRGRLTGCKMSDV